MNIFKKITQVVEAAKATQGPTTAQMIEQIHNEFENASTRALEQAKRTLDENKDIAREKGTLMKQLGFTNTTEAHRVDAAIAAEQKAIKDAQIVQKYQLKYPQYKFIFWDQVHSICHKYNLVCGVVGQYKGDVPMKNLKEI
jgi:hypothetical protein